MSVLRHGGTFLQRRLTKMYTDTKTSCESVTTASKAVDDPELVSLHRSFRTQRDRLLAWGLDWSDASAAQPNDIDESLTQAGFSDVVASVMSSIQELLNEAERLQQAGSGLPRKTGPPSKDALGALPPRTHWTNQDIDRSKTLLSELTGCIDTLYDLSRSRRNMSMSGQSGGRGRPSLSSSVKTLDDSAYFGASDSKGHLNPFTESKNPFLIRKQQRDGSDFAPFSNTVPLDPAFEEPKGSYFSPKYFSSTQNFAIDRSALQLSGASHDNSPPPYEMVAASTNSRVIGRMKTSALPFFTGSEDSIISILVEYTPMVLENQNVTVPTTQRLANVHQSLDQLVQNARISHLGLLKFLGYYLDTPNSRYAFIYQMPIDYFPFLRNPTDLLNDLKPKPLVSLLQSGDNAAIPNLESRFRLSYDLLMATLHLRSQNVVHGNLNSSNILIFPGLTNSNNDEVGITEDLRRPYLTSFSQFSGDRPSPEPLSSSMYRHPDDKKSMDDDAAWAYDLYSLGLVLMEIGLWTPVSRLWKMKYTNSMFKQRIENLYLQKLGPKCGSAYLNVVQLCLDAPNFHLSTQPLDDLKLRIPQVFHYPVLDLSAPESVFSFSMNFIYTMCKVAWSCCRMDLFSAPAAEELDDCLPLALVPGTEEATANEPVQDYKPSFELTDLPKQRFVNTPLGEMKPLKDKGNLDERKVKKRTFKKLTHVDIPQGHLNEWNMQLMPRLRKLLEKILRDSTESCSATLMMTGEATETAKPTICVTCSSVKRVRTALKKYFFFNRECWDLIVIRGDVQRSKVPRKKRRSPAAGRQEAANAYELPAERNLNPCYQPHPLCGASIGAFLNEEHLPPVSYGGAILVDGMPYGMTVHHMLEPPSDDEEAEDEPPEAPLRSSGNLRNDPWPPDPGLRNTYYEDDISEADLEFEISDDDDDDDLSFSPGAGFDDHWLSDGFSSDEEDGGQNPYGDEDVASIGDTAGIEPGEEPRQYVTQPAIDDVLEGFFPVAEDRDDDHLASHTLGYVHASSGVKRWTRRGIKHEIDWALIRIKDNRIDARNIVFDQSPGRQAGPPRQRHGGRDRTGVPIYLNNIARMEDLGGLQVHCCGRTSGLQTGQISPAMTLVKLHGRQSFSISFCVNGNFGAPGDSGAWVFDKSSGHVCGHVLAWSEKNQTAYIAPMDILLEDIARTLNATHISLPGNPNQSISYGLPQPSPIDTQHGIYRPDLRAPDHQLPVNIGLNIERSIGAVRPSPGLGEVSSYQHQPMPLMTQPRSLERQLA